MDKASESRKAHTGSKPASPLGFLSGRVMPGAWRNRVSATTGRSGASIP